MSDHAHNHHGTAVHAHEGEHKILPLSVYLQVFASLIVLTIITVWVAQFHFGILNGFVAMGIATLKATLVGMYFMHLKYDNKLYATILIGSVGFLLLLWGFTLFDYMTRVPQFSPL